jgi:hypothetical protein
VKRIAALLILFLLITMSAIGQVRAAELLGGVCPEGSTAVVCQENGNNQSADNNSIFGPDGIFTKVANVITMIVGIAAIIVVIIGGLQYVLATGDPQRINNAKNTILYALIGLVIAVAARAIIVFVIRRL